MDGIKAVILAGGAGTRLFPITEKMPKPLVPIMGKAAISRILSLLRRNGITSAAITLGCMADEMMKYFALHGGEGVNLRFYPEKKPLGTAGALPKMADVLSDTFVVISGDAVCDFNLREVMDFHIRKGACATLIAAKSKFPTEFGCISYDKNGLITDFAEKPAWRYVTDNKINTGIYVLDKSIISMIKPGVETDFSRDLFPKLKGKIYACEAAGYWCDIGSPDRFYACNRDALHGRIGGIDGSAYFIGKNTFTAENAVISDGTVIGADCRLGTGCRIDEAVIMDNVSVGAGARIERAIICPDVKIGAGATVCRGSIVGAGIKTADGAYIPPKTKLSSGSAKEKEKMIMEEKIFSEGNENIFFEYGAQGNMGTELTPQFCTALGSALCRVFGSRGIFMCDESAEGRLVTRFIMGGAQAQGACVTDCGEGFLQLLNFSASSGGFDFGIYAKHKKNGFCRIYVCDKFGTPIGMKKSRMLMRETEKGGNSFGIGTHLHDDYSEKYAAFLSASAAPLENMKITVPETAAMRLFATTAKSLGADVSFGVKNEIMRGGVFVFVDDDESFEISCCRDGNYELIDRWHATAAVMLRDIERGAKEIFISREAPTALCRIVERLNAVPRTYADFLYGEKDDENDRMRAAGQIWQDEMLLALTYLSLADKKMNFPEGALFAAEEENYDLGEESASEMLSLLCTHGAKREAGTVTLSYDSGTAYVCAACENELIIRTEADTPALAALTMEYTKNAVKEMTEEAKIK